MQYAAVFIILLVGAVVYVISRNRTNREQSEAPRMVKASNVISMEGHRKAKQNTADQLCSSCKKKNGKLVFMPRITVVWSDSARIARLRRRNEICCRFEE